MFGNRITQKKCWIVGRKEKKLVGITGLKNPMGDPRGDKNPMHILFFEKLASIIIYVNVYVSLADQIYQAVVIAVFCKLKDKTNSWFNSVQGVITHIHVIEVNLSNLKSFL